MGAVWLGTLGLGLALMTGASPPRVQMPKAVCTPRGDCITLKEEERTAEGLPLLRMEEKVPERLAEKKAFSLWLAWPQEAEKLRPFTSRQAPFQAALTTPEGRFEIFVPQDVLVRRTAKEPPALLVHASFDPATTGASQAPLHELIVAAVEHKLLTPEQQKKLLLKQKVFEIKQGALLEATKKFRAHPSRAAERGSFLDKLSTVPVSLFVDPDAPAFSPETFLTGAQRTALRKAGYEVVGQHSLKYSESSELAYQLELKAYSVEQLVREWNAGLRGPAAGIENLPRPRLDFDRAHRLDDVSLTLDVRNDTGVTRMEQVLQRLLQVPGVRRGADEPLPPER